MNTNELFVGLSLARDILVDFMQRELDSKDYEMAARSVAAAIIELNRLSGTEQEAVVNTFSSIDSSSTEEEILASLEGLRKKFPENYVVWEIPGVPLKINGEDWVLEWHPDSYYLTRGTPESIKEARILDWRNTSLTYKDRYVHLRVDGSLSSVPSVQLVPVTMPLKDMAKAIRKIKE